MIETRDLPLWDFEVDTLAELLAAHDRMAREATPPVRTRPSTVRRLAPAAAAALAAGAVVSATLVTTGGNARRPTRGSSAAPSRPASIAAIRAKSIAALDDAGADILHARTDWLSGTGPGCVEDQWTSPAQPVPGEQERERSLVVCGGRLDQDVETITTAVADPPGPVPPLLSHGPDGSLLLNGQDATTTGEYIGVDGATQTWWDLPSTRMTRPLNQETATTVRAELANGTYASVGHATIDGRDTLELRRTIATIVHTLWVDATTSLPVRSALAAGGTVTTTDYEFLPPTDDNLARLAPVVPPGYTKVSGPPANPGG